MKRISAFVVAVAVSLGVVTHVDALATNCSVGKSDRQAAAICFGGSGVYRVGVRQINGVYKWGPIVFVGRASVVNTSSQIVSAWVERY